MRLLAIVERGSYTDYDLFKKELNSYPYIYEIFHFAHHAGRSAEYCERYAREELEYYATPIWNVHPGDKVDNKAVYEAAGRVQKAIWFTRYPDDGRLTAIVNHFMSKGIETRIIVPEET